MILNEIEFCSVCIWRWENQGMGQKTWWNCCTIRCSNLTSNNVRRNGCRASSLTPNLPITSHPILDPNSRWKIPPTRCDVSKNPILMPADCLCSWCLRTEAQYFDYSQCASENTGLSTKFSEIGIWSWPASGQKSRKAYCSWSWFWTATSWLKWCNINLIHMKKMNITLRTVEGCNSDSRQHTDSDEALDNHS
jgi:hypothetical protein